MLQIAPSGYRRYAACQRSPQLRCARAKRDEQLMVDIRRGKVVRTTIADQNAAFPLDRVNRQFNAERPNQLWVSDFTYVSTWQG